MEFKDGQVNIVDYKTGNTVYAKEKLLGPNDKNPLGGDYWRQAVFYKLMIDNDSINNWKVNQVIFDFIEPEKDSKNYLKVPVIISPEDEKIVRNQVKEVYEKIKNYEFEKGCGKSTCTWCNFVKDSV